MERVVTEVRVRLRGCALSTTTLSAFPGHAQRRASTSVLPTKRLIRNTRSTSANLHSAHDVQNYEGHGYAANTQDDDATKSPAVHAADAAPAPSRASRLLYVPTSSQLYANLETRKRNKAVSQLTSQMRTTGSVLTVRSPYHFSTFAPA